MSILQKEVGKLRSKLGAKAGYENIMDLENKIREADMMYERYSKESKGLQTLRFRQDKHLSILMKSKESTATIEDLNNKLKEMKEKNKDLEKRIQSDTTNYQKYHENFVDLQERLQEIREMKQAWKSALAEGSPAPSEDVPKKKSEDEILRNTIMLIQKKMSFEKNSNLKQTEEIRAEIAQLQLAIREIEKENKLNAAKIRELKPLVKHKQLAPLQIGTVNTGSPQPVPIKLEL